MTDTPDVGDIYPDEEHKLREAEARLQARFEFTTGFGSTDRRLLEQAAAELFGEVGWKVHVTWKEILTKSGTSTDVWLPGIELVGRVKPEEELDHDRYKWGVVKGLADGQAGYIREDGTLREDPKSKLILPK